MMDPKSKVLVIALEDISFLRDEPGNVLSDKAAREAAVKIATDALAAFYLADANPARKDDEAEMELAALKEFPPIPRHEDGCDIDLNYVSRANFCTGWRAAKKGGRG